MLENRLNALMEDALILAKRVSAPMYGVDRSAEQILAQLRRLQCSDPPRQLDVPREAKIRRRGRTTQLLPLQLLDRSHQWRGELGQSSRSQGLQRSGSRHALIFKNPSPWECQGKHACEVQNDRRTGLGVHGSVRDRIGPLYVVDVAMLYLSSPVLFIDDFGLLFLLSRCGHVITCRGSQSRDTLNLMTLVMGKLLKG